MEQHASSSPIKLLYVFFTFSFFLIGRFPWIKASLLRALFSVLWICLLHVKLSDY